MIEKVYPEIYAPVRLAGNTAQTFLIGNDRHWMREICSRLEPLSNIVVFKSSLYSFCDDSAKLLWEYTWLQYSDSVVFWLSEMPNPTVEYRLKEMLATINKKIFVGISSEISMREYLILQIIGLRHELPIASSVSELAQQVFDYYIAKK